MVPLGLNAVVYGLEGRVVSDAEKRFFVEQRPLGFILFSRNIDTPNQVRDLVQSLREIMGWHCPILIDQEGGRVARLRAPNWPEFPPMERFASMVDLSIDKAEVACYVNAKAIGHELAKLGINVDCAPVADLRIDGAHDIVGDRSFGSDPDIVACLARKMAAGLHDSGVMSVVKHIPGHGRAMADSHEDLPVVDTELKVLEMTDFRVFRMLSHLPWAMTAHIVYTELDPDAPATCSSKVIQYIRDSIGYNGLLLSDDLSMKALKGSFEERTKQALAAGCDIVLHCNGKMEEMQAIASVVAAITDASQERLQRGFDFLEALGAD